MMNFKIILLLALVTSCAFVEKKLNLSHEANEYKYLGNNDGPLYCAKKMNPLIIGSDERNNNSILRFLKKEQQEIDLSFIEKAVLIHLIQMRARPDNTSSQSKLEFFYKRKNANYFRSFYSENGGHSFFKGLETILRDFKAKRSLKDLISLIDRKFIEDLFVDERFAKFLESHQADLEKNESLKKYYLRAEETLKQGETLPVYRILPLYNKVSTIKAPFHSKSYLYSFYDQHKKEFHCNYDMNHYQQSLFFISDYSIEGNVFGYHEGEESFIATTSLENKLQSFAGSPQFEGSSEVRSLAFCHSDTMALVSSHSRDPGQHLYHLIEYDLGVVKEHEELQKMISFSRHLFLTNPVRLIYESQRGTKEQLQELLELNAPLYNAESLGRIWGWLKQPKDGQFSFHLDTRMPGSLSCKE